MNNMDLRYNTVENNSDVINSHLENKKSEYKKLIKAGITYGNNDKLKHEIHSEIRNNLEQQKVCKNILKSLSKKRDLKRMHKLMNKLEKLMKNFEQLKINRSIDFIGEEDGE